MIKLANGSTIETIESDGVRSKPKFDSELFYSLCDKYDVELSTEYNKPMMRYDDNIIELDKVVTLKPHSMTVEESFVESITKWIKQYIEDNKHLSEEEIFEFLKDKYGDCCDVKWREKL